jgi:hypothetical protein
MRLIYPLTVTFTETSFNPRSIVRIKSFVIRCFDREDLIEAAANDQAVNIYVANDVIEAYWPHYFYVLVSQTEEQRNLSRLRWTTFNALYLFRARTAARRTKSKQGEQRQSQQQQQQQQQQQPQDYNQQHRQQQQGVTIVDFELVLYDVDTSLTSIYDEISMLDDWTDLDRKNARKKDGDDENGYDFTRANNLYRIRLESMAEYRYLFEYFRDNAHYNQELFSVPVNLLYDQFRFALDVYVANLRFKIKHEQASKVGRDTYQNNSYREIIKKWTSKTRSIQDVLRNDQVELNRWFACGKWCVFDIDRGCTSTVPRAEFVWCVRTVLGLNDHQASDKLLYEIFDCPLSFVPHVVWDIETVALGKGTIPRGITDDQKISSIAVVIERPLLEVGRLVVLWVLVPAGEDAQKIRDLRVVGPGCEGDAEKLSVSHTIIHVYEDERALLMDFLLDMFVNRSVLVDFFGVRPTRFSNYENMCTLLVGYNSIEYDYEFLLNRCLYFSGKAFTPFIIALRGFCSMSRAICNSFVFNDSQLCLDMMHYLMARNRQLKSYKLSAVLKVYGCDIEKIDFSAVLIRRLYYPERFANDKLPMDSPLDFLRFVLRYNVFDCLSLCDLLTRTSFASRTTVMMEYFFASLELVMYKGNSSLLPTLIQLDNLREKREFAVVRQPQRNNFLCSFAALDNSLIVKNQKELETRFRVHFRIERLPFAPSNSENPYTAVLNYQRVISGFAMNFKRIKPRDVYEGRIVFSNANELELLRIGEKTYIGGMNFASSGHAKFPILMDYNSFYPSIIRSYRLDVCNVAVFTVKQLLLMIPIPLLECILHTGILRLFDYTSLDDVDFTIDLDRHRGLFHGEEWHEAVEYRTLEQLICTSRHFDRRFLALIYNPRPSTIDGIVTNALKRRAVWKRKKKEHPDDVVVQFMEMMEKLLANSLYGYMNFSLSAIFSRATAAAVTLLCRNAFCRTRRIIESKELIATTRLDPNLYKFRVVYIDTDGCIFVLDKANSSVVIPTATVPTEPWFRLYDDLEPSDTVRVYDRLTDTINKMLNLKHVTLAAEHYDSIAVSVFATKKYVLLKMPGGKVKCTGFESNAARPIRELYDVVLRNTLRAFHIYRLVEYPRFVVTIRHHRLFFFAVFDYLYERWKAATDATAQDFGLNRPLNPKTTKGEMTDFIDRVLYQYQYSPGERVWVMKVVDDERCVEDGVFYPSRGKFVMISEIEGSLNTVVPNLKFYVGGYMRYLYQCVEAHQSLRASVRETREGIEPGYYLDSFQSIYSYCWACWLYVRIYAQRGLKIDGVWWPETRVSKTGSGSVEEGDSVRRLPKYLDRQFFSDKFIKPEDNPFYVALFNDASSACGTDEDIAIKRRCVLDANLLSIDPLL